MRMVYELHFKTELGGFVYCGDFDDINDAHAEKEALQAEFPMNEYFINGYMTHKEF